MKLRLRGDSLRLRLTQPEVRQLAAEGRVADRLHVAPGAGLDYGIRAADVEALAATWEGGALVVVVPRAWVGLWAEGDGVGFDGEQDAGDGRRLALLVEKDFACLVARPDETDAFPNPRADAC